GRPEALGRTPRERTRFPGNFRRDPGLPTGGAGPFPRAKARPAGARPLVASTWSALRGRGPRAYPPPGEDRLPRSQARPTRSADFLARSVDRLTRASDRLRRSP